MGPKETITLVTVCDNQFTVLLATLLKSIELNYKATQPIHVYIVNDGISSKNVKKLESSLNSGKLKLIWKSMDEAIPDHLKLPLDNTTFPANTYVRACIPYFIPPELEKVIYLDVDMLVLSDISDLWATDLGDYLLAAVVDRCDTISSPWGGILNYRELGLDPQSKYFNAGLLVIAPQEWRSLKIPEKVFKCADDNSAYLNFADQYCLNVVFNENWLKLDPLWNSYAQNHDDSPHLIHFTGMKPIFRGYSYNADYKKLFFYYLNLTNWKGLKPKSNLVRFTKKLYNKVTKRLGRLFRS